MQQTAGNAAVARWVTAFEPADAAVQRIDVLVARSGPGTKEEVRHAEGQGALTPGNDYLIFGTWREGDTHDSYAQRVYGQWVTWRYGNTLSGAVRVQIVQRMSANSRNVISNPTVGKQYYTKVDLKFIASLSTIAGRDPAARQADRREQEAGLPAGPPVAEAQPPATTGEPAQTTAPTKDAGAQEPPSDTEFQGAANKTANTPALPASLSGPEIAPTGSIGAYTMRLDYSVVGAGANLDADSRHLAQVVEAMNFVRYHWESFDVTALVQGGMTEQIERQQAQKSVSGDDKVGRLDPTKRRAEQAADTLAEETAAAAGELASPIDAAHGGTAADVIVRAQANIDSLMLTPASAIVSFGGVALGALADVFGGDFHEQEIPWPRKAGYYMVRCIAQPKPRPQTRRAASVAIKLVQVRPVSTLARAAVELPHALVAEKQVELELARRQGDSPERIAALERQLAELRLTASGAATDVIDLKIREKEAELAATPDWRKGDVQKQLDALKRQREHAGRRAAGMHGTIWRPEAAIVSKLDGQTYPLLLQLGRVPGEQGEVWRLSDVSTADGRYWDGRGATASEAVRNAAQLMARGNSYGPGTLAIKFPEGGPFEAGRHTHDNINTGTALARRRLADLAAVLAVLGLFVPGVGQIAAVVGAAVAADRLLDRWQNGSLRMDADAIGDIIGLFGAAAQAVSAVGKVRVMKVADRFVLAAAGADEQALLAALRTATKVEDLAGKAAALANWGGFAFGQVNALNAFLEVTKAELSGGMSHAEARRRRAEILFGALRENTLQFAPPPTKRPKSGTGGAPAPTPTGQRPPVPAAPGQGRTRPMDPARLKVLEPELGDLAGRVELVENPAIGSSVLVRYRDGQLHIEVGPDAQARHVRAHREVARILGRYQGPLGVIRQLLDRIGSLLRLTPGYGREGFERRLEVSKLRSIEASLQQMLREIDAQVERVGGQESVPAKDREALQKELETIQAQLTEHQKLVDSYAPGRGFVAALDAATAAHFANEAAGIKTMEKALNNVGRADLITMMEQVAQREASEGGNIVGFREWVKESVSRVTGTDPDQNRKQAVEKGVELSEIWRLSEQIRHDPNLVVQFTPGGRRKTFDIRVVTRTPPSGESPIRRELDVKTHSSVPTTATELHTAIGLVADKVPDRPRRQPQGRQREATVSVLWFVGSQDVKKGKGYVRVTDDGTTQALRGEPPTPVGKPGSIPQALLDNLRSSNLETVGKNVHRLQAINITTQAGQLLWRFENAGTDAAPDWKWTNKPAPAPDVGTGPAP